MDVEELAMLLQTMDFEPVSPEAFTKASQAVRSGLLNLEQDQQLMLYALFKQASEGKLICYVGKYYMPDLAVVL